MERRIDDELPFEIPENWCWCRLGTIAAVLGGKRIPAGRKLTECNTGHVYIRVSDMTDGGVSTDRLLYVPEDIYPSISKYIINKADVFITVAGTIGRVGKIPDELDGANLTENADRLVLAVVNQDWLIKVLQSGMIQEQITFCLSDGLRSDEFIWGAGSSWQKNTNGRIPAQYRNSNTNSCGYR